MSKLAQPQGQSNCFMIYLRSSSVRLAIHCTVAPQIKNDLIRSEPLISSQRPVHIQTPNTVLLSNKNKHRGTPAHLIRYCFPLKKVDLMTFC